MTTRLLLCRHGATNERGRICGSYDVALSPEGEAQAQALARALTAMRPTAVYSSPLRRARDTAATISEPVTVADLREVGFGDFEGLTAAEAEALDPATFAAWTTDPSTVRFPGGGCYGEVAARVCATAARLRRRHRGETIVVVTHDGPLRALLAHALGLGASDAFRLELRHCGVSVVDWHGNVPAVRLVNADPATLALGALRPSMRD